MSRPSAAIWMAHILSLLVFAGLILQIVNTIVTNDHTTHAGYLFSSGAGLVVGWILAWKRPLNPIGWIIIAVVGLGVSEVPALLLGEALRSHDPAAAAWLYSWGGERSNWSWLPPTALLFTQLPLRFPTGNLPSPRWRWFSWYTIGAVIIASAIQSTTPAMIAPGLANPTYLNLTPAAASALSNVALVLGGSSVLGSVASLFVRNLRSDAIERAQLRWVFWGLCIPTVVLIAIDSSPASYWRVSNGWLPQALTNISLGTEAFVPAAILVAVLRYRLYDIDRIISRTVSYAIVTIVIIGVYVGIVLGVGALLPKTNSVGVAIATLAAAAVFLPLLRVVQRLVDRRFNRAAYNAQKVVDAFGERLRSGADPHAAGADLVDAVDQTLQPSAVGIWTRVGSPGQPRATE